MSCRKIFQVLWANNGDAISRQYAGTAALKVKNWSLVIEKVYHTTTGVHLDNITRNEALYFDKTFTLLLLKEAPYMTSI